MWALSIVDSGIGYCLPFTLLLNILFCVTRTFHSIDSLELQTLPSLALQTLPSLALQTLPSSFDFLGFRFLYVDFADFAQHTPGKKWVSLVFSEIGLSVAAFYAGSHLWKMASGLRVIF